MLALESRTISAVSLKTPDEKPNETSFPKVIELQRNWLIGGTYYINHNYHRAA